jgi:predicted lipoprotein with Yx(FWY)xxD motif
MGNTTPTTSKRQVRLATAALVVGGFFASAVVVGSAGAATSTGVVATAHSAKFGKILVSGQTVYTLKASKTPCKAACLHTRPEVLLPTGMSKPTAGSGVQASKLGTVRRSGGALQLTYGGKPLYWFIGDSGPGQVKGNVTDIWGKWSVVVTAKPKHASSGSSGGSNSGSGGSNAGSGGVSF